MTDFYDGQGKFEWNSEKAKRNTGKHKVTFEEPAMVSRDPFSLALPDPEHSETEEPLLLIGLSDRRRLLVVSYVERGETLRVISARTTDADEKRDYEEEPSYGN